MTNIDPTTVKKMLVAMLGAGCCVSAAGQDLLQCVNPDAAAALLVDARSTAPPVVTADRPAQLADYSAPPAFAWIGSMTTESETTAAFKTDLDTEQANETFIASLRQAGFAVSVSGERSRFVLTSPPLRSSICRDGELGTVILRERAGARFVTVTFSTRLEPRSCEDAMAPPDNRAALAAFMPRAYAYLPQVVLPPSIVGSTRPGAIPTGVGSASSTRLEVEGVTSMASLVDGVADQLRAQGWTPDASWSGEWSAGSTWVREVDDGTRFAGKLKVERIGDRYYSLELKVASRN